MTRIWFAVLTIIFLGTAVATAQEAPIPAAPEATRMPQTSNPGRYVFYPSQQGQRGLEYLLDTATGDMWVISRDPDTNYVYLGFVPKGPSFSFQDIIQQKQRREFSPQQ